MIETSTYQTSRTRDFLPNIIFTLIRRVLVIMISVIFSTILNTRLINFLTDPSIIKSLHKFFNLSMTYKTNSDVPVPYGKVVQVVPHPTSRQELEKLIMDFGVANKHLAVKEKSESFVTQFASNCNTHSKRKATVQNSL